MQYFKNIFIILLGISLNISYAQTNEQYINSQLRSFAYKGNVDLIKTAIQKGADINTVDQNGFTPLMWAIYNNNTIEARFLIENKATVTNRSLQGHSSILLAAQHGNFELIVLLGLYGALLTDRDNNGNTVLHYAVNSGRLDLVKFLIEQGINSNLINNMGKYPVDYAASQGYGEILDYLISIGSYVDYNSYGPKEIRIVDTTSYLVDTKLN